MNNSPLTDPGSDYRLPTTGYGDPKIERALLASDRAKNFLRQVRKPEGFWCAELESNATITAEYVFLRHALGLGLEDRREKLIRYFLGDQKDDGSWGIAWNLPGDVSTTAETYLALRILGLGRDDARLGRAERFIRESGGLERMRVFTRINFAMFGLFPWDAVPAIPPEFILLPASSPVNIYALSSWARGTMVPLFIVCHHRPLFALPNGGSRENDWLDHLWINPADKRIPYSKPALEVLKQEGPGWRAFFAGADALLRGYDRIQRVGPLRLLRERALAECERWVLEHQEESGDWAGIFPPMLNGVLALHLSGHPLDSGPVRKGLEAIERFAIDDGQGLRIEACQSPVWDTILAMIGMLDAGEPASSLDPARRWITERQLLADHGDWKVYNPSGPPGGWSFEYVNSWYPDVDDTAAVIIGFLKHDRSSHESETVRKAVAWIVSMQNPDGGWAAFDRLNDKLFLNQIPFSDMDSLCDPSSPDVTGRVLEALGLLDDPRYREACAAGIQYLRKSQEPEGSWFGRWGVNYVYGTSNVLCALSRQAMVSPEDAMIRRALDWLKRCQNRDGGWGEGLESYADRSRMGKGASTASQTAWALMGLLAYLGARDPAIQRGIAWLVSRQNAAGSWEEREFTGTGFPRHFYIRYHLYRHYFPLMALGRYCQRLVQ